MSATAFLTPRRVRYISIYSDPDFRFRQPVHAADCAPRARSRRILRNPSVQPRTRKNPRDESARDNSFRRTGQSLRAQCAGYRRRGAQSWLSGARNLLRPVRNRAAHGRAQRGLATARIRTRNAGDRRRRRAVRRAQRTGASRLDESRRQGRDNSEHAVPDRTQRQLTVCRHQNARRAHPRHPVSSRGRAHTVRHAGAPQLCAEDLRRARRLDDGEFCRDKTR